MKYFNNPLFVAVLILMPLLAIGLIALTSQLLNIKINLEYISYPLVPFIIAGLIGILMLLYIIINDEVNI